MKVNYLLDSMNTLFPESCEMKQNRKNSASFKFKIYMIITEVSKMLFFTAKFLFVDCAY